MRRTLQEITFFGTYTYTADDFAETTAAMFDGRLGDLDWPEQRSLGNGVKPLRIYAQAALWPLKLF